MPPTSTSRSSLWIPTTSPSETIPASTGSSPLSTSTAKEEVSPPPARSTEVCASRATEPTTPSVVPTEPPGRDATPSPCADTAKYPIASAVDAFTCITSAVNHCSSALSLFCGIFRAFKNTIPSLLNFWLPM
eukprot:Colp12_sorted_trinity150504_noHs@14017